MILCLAVAAQNIDQLVGNHVLDSLTSRLQVLARVEVIRMLSDVLALGTQPDVLLTGLLNPQVIRTAEMLDTACVVFLRGKEPEASILELAEKCGVCVLTSPLEMYDACGILHQHGVTGAK